MHVRTESGGLSEGNVKKKLVKSRLKWAGRVKRMGDGKLTKRADAYKVKETSRGRRRMR